MRAKWRVIASNFYSDRGGLIGESNLTEVGLKGF